jgi:hypothetical protein
MKRQLFGTEVRGDPSTNFSAKDGKKEAFGVDSQRW